MFDPFQITTVTLTNNKSSDESETTSTRPSKKPRIETAVGTKTQTAGVQRLEGVVVYKMPAFNRDEYVKEDENISGTSQRNKSTPTNANADEDMSDQSSERNKDNGANMDQEDQSKDGGRAPTHAAHYNCLWDDCEGTLISVDYLKRHVDRNHVQGQREPFECHWDDCEGGPRVVFLDAEELMGHMEQVHFQELRDLEGNIQSSDLCIPAPI